MREINPILITKILPLFLILALAFPASATNLNFQNPGDVTQTKILTTPSGTDGGSGWAESTTGVNNYYQFKLSVGGVPCTSCGAYMVLTSPSPTTYAAVTHLNVGEHRPTVGLFNSAGGLTHFFTYSSSSLPYKRIQVFVIGGSAYIYGDNVLLSTLTGVSANPSYVGFGVRGPSSAGITGETFDDYIYGDSENRLILGLPESDNDAFIIMDDFVNDANDGLYNTTSGTQANANYMTGTWSDGNTSIGTPLENRSVYLKHYDTNTIYWTGYTNGAYTGTWQIPIKTNVIDAGAPDGYYVLYSGTTAMSDMILKRSTGATITFDKDDYSVDDKATVTWEVQTGDYWDTSLYSYRAFIRDIYGVEKVSYAVTERTGTFEYLFNSADDPGVYIAVITATPRAGGNPLYIGTDYAELSQYGVISGFVTDHLGTGISGANVTFEQGSYTSVGTSGYDGNFTTLPFFITGTELTCNVTETGYRQHYYTVLPKSTKTKNINFTLPIEPTPFTGLGIDGVAMEGYLTPGTINIINGYGNPIPFATVNVTNTTTMETYQNTTNFWGWYMCDVGSTCDLVFNQTYNIEGSKTGYQNSSIYQKKPYGVLT